VQRSRISIDWTIWRILEIHKPVTCKYRGIEGTWKSYQYMRREERKNIGDKVAIRIHADRAGWEGIELFGNIRESRISLKTE